MKFNASDEMFFHDIKTRFVAKRKLQVVLIYLSVHKQLEDSIERWAMTEKLVGGDEFPSLSLNTAGGNELVLPGDLGAPLTIILFYRGHW